MQVGQRLRVVERPPLRHDAGKKIGGTVGLNDERREMIAIIEAPLVGRRFQQRPFRPAHLIRRRQVEERQVIGALIVFAAVARLRSIELVQSMLEGRAPLAVDEPGRRVRKGRGRIGRGEMPLRFKEKSPA